MAYRYRRRNPETGEMELYEDAGRSIPVDFGGMNLTGTPNLDYLQNLVNLAQQPQLGSDEFGSYSIPVSDPTYRSGFDYARSIAGGIPMSQVIAPGVSYSPEQPMGYTQEQLNLPKDVDIPPPPPAILPPTREPDDPRYFGTGIGGVTIFDDDFDRKRIPPRNIFGGVFDKDAIEKIVQERIAESKKIQETKPDMPTFIPEVPTGRDFSIDREVLERPMISGLENRDFMDADSLITGVPNGRDFSIDREPIPPQDFGYGPGIMPPLPPIDIDKLIPPVDLPPINIMDLPPVNIPSRIPVDLPPLDLPIVRPPTIMDKPRIMDRQTIMDELTGNRFSINQKRPMGLF